MLTDIPLGLLLDRFPIKNTAMAIAASAFVAELAVAFLF